MVVKVKLISDWKKILRRAWSIRLALLAATLSSVEVTLPLFADVVPRGVFASLSMVVGVAAVAARLVAQPKMDASDT